MRVLVGCEESQRVCIAFRSLGHEAYSCDIKPCSGGHPEWHIQDDLLSVLYDDWDLIIAHPPCTYLSNVTAPTLFSSNGFDSSRYLKGLDAASFFFKIYNAPCPFICVENPLPLSIWGLPKRNRQIIQPYMFGDPYTKRTCLWLKNLPFLKPTNYVFPDKGSYIYTSYAGLGCSRSEFRSKTFPGIASAMASQWSDLNFFIQTTLF